MLDFTARHAPSSLAQVRSGSRNLNWYNSMGIGNAHQTLFVRNLVANLVPNKATSARTHPHLPCHTFRCNVYLTPSHLQLHSGVTKLGIKQCRLVKI